MKNFDDIVDAFMNVASASASSPNVWVNFDVERAQAEGEVWNAAFFMLLFAQFEAAINDLCDNVVSKRRHSNDWLRDRAWNIINLESLHFMRKVALLTPQGKTVYNRIHQLYTVRNQIAHGDAHRTSTEITTLAAELPRLLSALEENP